MSDFISQIADVLIKEFIIINILYEKYSTASPN